MLRYSHYYNAVNYTALKMFVILLAPCVFVVLQLF